MPTVIDRIRALGFEATKRQRWEIGARVRDKWVEEHGELPEKQLRTKTSGEGSHCLAVYPNDFVPKIDEVIRREELADESQGRLF
jgi:hypothetical protein